MWVWLRCRVRPILEVRSLGLAIPHWEGGRVNKKLLSISLVVSYRAPLLLVVASEPFVDSLG